MDPSQVKITTRMFTALVILALAFTVACDRDSPMQATGERDQLTSGTTGGSVVFSARATGARSTVLGNTISLCGAGPLPPQGGSNGAVLLDGRIQGVLRAQFFHSVAFGAGDVSRAQANANDLDITVGGQRVQCHIIVAAAEAKCVNGQVVVSAGSNIADFRLNGKPITISGQPNQTISLPLGLGRVVINEQVRAGGSLTVRGVHIVIAGVAEVAVCEAQAGIACGVPDCSPAECVTGCGSINVPGATASFGVSGGIRAGAAWGHLAYCDRSNGGPRVKATGVTSYTVVSSTTRRMQGPCEVNGQGGFTYSVDMTDNGASDAFSIQLSNGYRASGAVQGGSIKLLIPCR